MTVADGSLSDVFYPSLERPALHELRFLVAAAGSPPIDDGHEAQHEVRPVLAGVPAFEVQSSHREYRLTKTFLPGDDLDAVLVTGTFEPEMPDLRLFVQVTPHLDPGGDGNHGQVRGSTPPVLEGMAGTVHFAVVGPFQEASAGYKRTSDIEVELDDGDGELRRTYRSAGPGNVSLGARLSMQAGPFQLALGFGRSPMEAEETARKLLRRGEAATRAAHEEGWRRQVELPALFGRVAGDGGDLGRASLVVLRALEDKAAPGAFVAAPAAPWGTNVHDGNHVYHRIWPRDLYHCAAALLAAGDVDAARRALRHLAANQRPDGSWPQNWGLDGRPHWDGLELDEVATPILLAWRLKLAGALDWDPWPALVRRAAAFIVRTGPATPLDRWEDAGGLSPSTLAACVSALVGAAEFAGDAGEELCASHFLDVADYWADRAEAWCFSPRSRCYVRAGQDPDAGPSAHSAPSVDFLELVRLGVRPPDHPAVLASLATVDRLLRFDSPVGPAWRRFAGDSYGEQADGGPWAGLGHGIGRPWPVLAGERGQYEAAAGNIPADLVRALECFAGPALVLPEQIWDGDARPERNLRPGSATGSAAPLGWAHAEYLKLLASVAQGRPVDLLASVAGRYRTPPHEPAFIWSRAHPIGVFGHGRKVKVQLPEPATVRWSADEWASWKESPTADTTLGFHVAELPTQIMRPGAVMSWTIQYPDGRREDRNYSLTCR